MPIAGVDVAAHQAAFDALRASNPAEWERQVQQRLADIRHASQVHGYTWEGRVELGQFGSYDKDYFYAVQSLRDANTPDEVIELIRQQGTATSPITGPGNEAEADPLPGSTTPTPAQNSARAYIQDMLNGWGLGDLNDWAWEQILAGNTEMLPQLIRGTDQYRARFSGLEARRAAGLNVMSEAEYLNLEDNYRELFHRYGIPRGTFDTQAYLGSLIANDLSPAEVNDRLRVYQDAAYNAPAEVRNQLSHLYGVSEGGLTAYYMDPNIALPALEAQYAAAGAASAATRGGFGQLDRAGAERLAQLGAGGDDVGAFENLNRSSELFTGLGGSEVDQATMTRFEAAEAAFGGNAANSDRMRRRAEERVATFSGGGGFAQDNRGVSGLGSANT